MKVKMVVVIGPLSCIVILESSRKSGVGRKINVSLDHLKRVFFFFFFFGLKTIWKVIGSEFSIH